MTMPGFPTGYKWESPQQYLTYRNKFLQAYFDAQQRQNPREAAKQAELRGFIESQPRALYEQAISGLSRPMRGYFSSMYGDIYNRYLASQVAEAQAGNVPRQRFGDFLGGFNFEREYMRLPYMQRGGYQRRSLTPRTRFLPY